AVDHDEHRARAELARVGVRSEPRHLRFGNPQDRGRRPRVERVRVDDAVMRAGRSQQNRGGSEIEGTGGAAASARAPRLRGTDPGEPPQDAAAYMKVTARATPAGWRRAVTGTAPSGSVAHRRPFVIVHRVDAVDVVM